MRWYAKLAFIVFAWVLVVGLGIGRGLTAIHVNGIVVASIGGAFDLGLIVYCARVFRGAGENLSRARPPWQMTAHARLSRGLGLLFSAAAVLCLSVIPFAHRTRTTLAPVHGYVISCCVYAVLAFLYIRSGRRLLALELPLSAPQRSSMEGLEPVDVVSVPGETSRHRVRHIADVGVRWESGAALLGASQNDNTLDVVRDGYLVGTIRPKGSDFVASLRRTNASVEITLLRTGDRLWAEVPPGEALAIALADRASSRGEQPA